MVLTERVKIHKRRSYVTPMSLNGIVGSSHHTAAGNMPRMVKRRAYPHKVRHSFMFQQPLAVEIITWYPKHDNDSRRKLEYHHWSFSGGLFSALSDAQLSNHISQNIAQRYNSYQSTFLTSSLLFLLEEISISVRSMLLDVPRPQQQPIDVPSVV